jgi:hypothetical protein
MYNIGSCDSCQSRNTYVRTKAFISWVNCYNLARNLLLQNIATKTLLQQSQHIYIVNTGYFCVTDNHNINLCMYMLTGNKLHMLESYSRYSHTLNDRLVPPW